MKRLAEHLLLATAALSIVIFAAAPAIAAKPSTPPGQAAATIAVVEASLAYGDQAHFAVTTNATPTLVRMTCYHDGTASIGGSLIYSATTYTTVHEFGLYAPNWPSGGAECIAVVKLVTAQSPDRWKVIGETGFVVAP